jgi:hypothetical protein
LRLAAAGTQPAAFFGNADITSLDLVTKPKHFLTFHKVASWQKSGDVVPQQSWTSTQL